MAISKLGGTGSDNWELISSVTPTVATASVNFTGLTPYRKLLVRWTGIVLASSGRVSVRLNNDSGTNYDTSFELLTPSSATYEAAVIPDDTSFAVNTTAQNGTSNHFGMLMIENTDTAGLKNAVEGMFYLSTGPRSAVNHKGTYRASAVVSQVNVISSANFTAVGTVALYGVK